MSRFDYLLGTRVGEAGHPGPNEGNVPFDDYITLVIKYGLLLLILLRYIESVMRFFQLMHNVIALRRPLQRKPSRR